VSFVAACGFAVAPGDPDRLGEVSGVLGCTAEDVDDHATTIEATASSLAAAWSGQAASAYQDLSRESSAVYRGAAETLRTAAAVVRRYSAELARCRQEGITATQEAERCLAETETQTGRLRDAQRETGAAQRWLDAARARAGLHGANPAEVSAAQSALAQAQSEEDAASAAIEAAREELWEWQARGRQAWEDAQTSGAQAGASLGAVSMPPPPVVAPSASPGRSAPVTAHGKKARPRDVKRPRGRTIAGRHTRKPAGAPRAGHSSSRGGHLAFTATPLSGLAVAAPSRTAGGGAGRAGDGQGSGTMTIDPTAGTIDTVTHTKSGATVETITYTKSGASIETITYTTPGAHSGSGKMIVDPGPGPSSGPKRPGSGSSKGSGTTTVG
jgi:uncharacterized protein YukE